MEHPLLAQDGWMDGWVWGPETKNTHKSVTSVLHEYLKIKYMYTTKGEKNIPPPFLSVMMKSYSQT